MKKIREYILQSSLLLEKKHLGAHTFPNAEKDLHPLMKPLINDYRKKSDKYRHDVPILYHAFPEGTPSGKNPMWVNSYVDVSTTPNQKCSNCEYAYLKLGRGQLICSKLEKDIKARGWCDLWEEQDI